MVRHIQSGSTGCVVSTLRGETGPGGPGGQGGGGDGADFPSADDGDAGAISTGGGGGGAGDTGSQSGNGGRGASGIVVVRYQIASVASAKASGGVISSYNGKTIHTFYNSGDFNNTTGSPLTCEYVVVGGGGGAAEGGGGAGGYRVSTSDIGPGPNTVTVGAGGAYSAPRGFTGANSVFGPITSAGGGGGGGPAGGGNSGGSGGGGRRDGGNSGGSGNTPPVSPPQGNDGATSPSGPFGGAAGGGGAGQAGQAGARDGSSPGERGGNGGYGTQVPATFRNPASAPSDSSNPQSESKYFEIVSLTSSIEHPQTPR